jgi:hypothetical protein
MSTSIMILLVVSSENFLLTRDSLKLAKSCTRLSTELFDLFEWKLELKSDLLSLPPLNKISGLNFLRFGDRSPFNAML